MDLGDLDLFKDRLVDELVERALAPYVGLLPPRTLAAFRAALVETYTHHPQAQLLLKQLRDPPVVFESGEVATGDTADPATPAVPAVSGAKERGRR